MSRRWSARISAGNSSTTPLGTAGSLAPGFRAASSATNGVAASFLTITKPAGTVSNDVMVAMLTVQGDNNVVTPPAGWTEIRSDFHDAVLGANDVRSTLFWKRAGGAEPANYTFTTVGNSDLSGAIVGYTNIVTAGDPVNVTGGQTETAILGDNTLTAPSINVTAGSLLIGIFDFGDGGKTFIPPPGMVERVDFDADTNNVSFEVADQVFGAGGNTGDRTATHSPAVQPAEVGRGMVGQMIALTPAVGGGGDTFFGVAEDVLDFSGIRVTAESDRFGLIQVQFSQDGTNWRTTDEFATINGRFDPIGETFRSEIIPVRQRFVRINFQNKAGVAQTFFRLQTTLLPEADQPLHRTPERYVVHQALGVLVEPATFTTVLTVSGDNATRALETMAYGVTPENQSTTTSGFAYHMQLVRGAQSNHRQVVRNNVGSWQPVRFETRGLDILVQVRHDEALAQRFDAFLEVREP